MGKDLTPVREILDSTPGSPTYNWEKYGYSLITEESFEGGYHEGDYEKDGVIYCGYCHTPKQILHMWQGEQRAFPIHCRCKLECMARIQEEREELRPLPFSSPSVSAARWCPARLCTLRIL